MSWHSIPRDHPCANDAPRGDLAWQERLHFERLRLDEPCHSDHALFGNSIGPQVIGRSCSLTSMPNRNIMSQNYCSILSQSWGDAPTRQHLPRKGRKSQRKPSRRPDADVSRKECHDTKARMGRETRVKARSESRPGTSHGQRNASTPPMSVAHTSSVIDVVPVALASQAHAIPPKVCSATMKPEEVLPDPLLQSSASDGRLHSPFWVGGLPNLPQVCYNSDGKLCAAHASPSMPSGSTPPAMSSGVSMSAPYALGVAGPSDRRPRSAPSGGKNAAIDAKKSRPQSAAASFPQAPITVACAAESSTNPALMACIREHRQHCAESSRPRTIARAKSALGPREHADSRSGSRPRADPRKQMGITAKLSGGVPSTRIMKEHQANRKLYSFL